MRASPVGSLPNQPTRKWRMIFPTQECRWYGMAEMQRHPSSKTAAPLREGRGAYSPCPRPSAAAPPIGRRFFTTKPARSRCSTRRRATISDMSSSALWTRLRPSNRKAKARAADRSSGDAGERGSAESVIRADNNAADRTKQEQTDFRQASLALGRLKATLSTRTIAAMG